MSTNPIWPDITPDIYGPIITADDARGAMKATIDYWAPAYVAVMAERTGLPLVPFVAFEALYTTRALTVNANEATYWVTAEPGSVRLDRRGVDWFGTWRLECQVVVYGDAWDTTESSAWAYGGAVRSLLLQHPSLGIATGTATGSWASAIDVTTRWVKERYQPVEQQSRRTIGVWQGQFDVTAGNVLDASAGQRVAPVPPATFAPPGTQGNPDVTNVNVTITKTGVDG